MDTQEILNALNLGEDKDWEFKSAKGGMPGSMWESYSAMANTDGGAIVLGVKEKDGGFEVHGLDDPSKTLKDFWSAVNNRAQVNANLLSNADVQIETVDGKALLVIQVPRASRKQRPIYVGQNPLTGTYRRFNEGDYRCSDDEVGRMLADQAEQPADSLILPAFSLTDLDKKSLEQYRNRFASSAPAHPWLGEDDKGLLLKLGGWRRDRETGQEGITVAGLLMFGNDQAITDPVAIPQYHIDYREHLSDDATVRWTDRVHPDGTWNANLFQFFARVYPRLVDNLKIPFQYHSGMTTTTTPDPSAVQRIDESIVHEAIREAFVNCLIHGDFRGQGGIVVERFRDRLEFSNPGSLLLSFEQIVRGGVSECRNKTLQKMFALIGYGEKAGSGIDKIVKGWSAQKWRSPSIHEGIRPDRVRLVMPMVSLFPDESLGHFRSILGENLEGLDAKEVQAIVTADVEGCVTNQRLQQFLNHHTSDITKMLQELVAKGYLKKEGYGRWASYQLSDRLARRENAVVGTPHTTDENSTHTKTNSEQMAEQTPYIRPEDDPKLLGIAHVAHEKSRMPPDEMEALILALCEGKFLTPRQIGLLLNRNPIGIQQRFLRRMAQGDKLILKFPGEPNHPSQAYKTNSSEI